MKSNTIRVAVLMGGVSSERDISLKSGNEVSTALRKAGYSVVDIIVNDKNVEELNNHDIDVAFIALHGSFGEDGGIQAILEKRYIPYIGSEVDASRLAMNKIESKKIFDYNRLPTPAYVEASKFKTFYELTEAIKFIGMPLIVKPAMDGSSIGVEIARDMDELKNALGCAAKYNNHVLVEKYVQGREFTVGILLGKPLPIVEIKPKSSFYNYYAKYQDKQTEYTTSVNLNPEIYRNIQHLAQKAHFVLGCRDISRVDIILDNEGNPFLLEVNTIPGFTSRSLFPLAARAANIEFVQLCDMLVTKSANRKHKPLVSRVND